MNGTTGTALARRGMWMVLIAAGVAACSGGGGDTGGTTAPTSAPATSEAPASTSEGPATTEPAPEVELAPVGVNWAPAEIALSAPSRPAPPTFEEVTASAGEPPTPPGHPFRQSVYTRARFDVGGVRLVTASCSCWEGGSSAGVFGGLRTPAYLFRSVDEGATWSQVDLTAALGDFNGRIADVIESDDGLLMTITLTDASGSAPGSIAVLRSADGSDWQLASRIDGDGGNAIEGFALIPVGNSLVMHGGDAVCEFDGTDVIQSIGTSYQDRLWTSSDGGSTWAAQPKTDTAMDAVPLPSPAECDGVALQDINVRWGGLRPRAIANVGDRLHVWSANGEQIASSSDGLQWSASTIEGAVALPSGNVAEPVAESKSAAFVEVDGGVLAINVEPRRGADDTATGASFGDHIATWFSADGTEWIRQPLGRPVLFPATTATVWILASGTTPGILATDADGAVVAAFTSEERPVEDWATCQPVAGANCAFATDLGAIEPGADLAGIDLSYTVLSEVDLTNASLVGATLVGAQFYEVVLAGADLSGADLTGAGLYSDPTGATFDGAIVNQTLFDGRFFLGDWSAASVTAPKIYLASFGVPDSVSLVGADLTGYGFYNYGDDTSFVGRDMSGANLTDTYFAVVDLSGANLSGAVLAGATFSSAICPDGQPSDPTGLAAAACRL